MENLLIDKDKGKFTLQDSAVASLVFIVLNFAFLELYYLLPTSFRSNPWVYYLASFLIEATFFLTAIIVAKARKTKINFFEATGMKKKVNGKIVLYCFLISVVCIIGFGSLTNSFIYFLEKLGYSSVLSDITITNFGTYIVYVIVSCIAPAIFEETLFRGVIASGMKERGFKFALIGSALIFMLMHGNAEQTVHQFIIGLVVGYMFLKTGNLWLGVLVHFFNNFISVTSLYLYSTVSSVVTQSSDVVIESVTYSWGSIVAMFVFAIIYAVVAYHIIKAIWKRLSKEDEKLNGKGDINVQTSQILIDGETVETDMIISSQKTEETNEFDEIFSGQTSEQNKPVENETEKKPVTIATIVLYTMSILYLVSDWVLSLLLGFGIG